jgi:hypothetical protein
MIPSVSAANGLRLVGKLKKFMMKEETMDSVKDKPVEIVHPLIKNAIGMVFPEAVDHKTDTRSEDQQEARQKEKKRRDDD